MNGTVDIGAYEFECQVDDDCYDADICTHDQCGDAGLCVFPPEPNLYGDVNHDDVVNVFDILCILKAIEHDFTECTFESCDVQPCATDCDDDGVFEDGRCVLNVFDTFAVSDVREGYIACGLNRQEGRTRDPIHLHKPLMLGHGPPFHVPMSPREA